MADHGLRYLVQQLAHRYHLRRVEADNKFLGLHRGVSIVVCESGLAITFAFTSPTSHIGDALARSLAGSRYRSEAGLRVCLARF